MRIGESRINVSEAETWKVPQNESSRITAEADLKGKVIDAKSILEAAKSPEDLKNELNTFKTPAELQPLYTELTLKYGQSTDNDEMDALEPILDALKDKMKSLRESPPLEVASDSVAESIPEATVETAAEVSAEQPSESEEKPKDNLIDRAAEFKTRTKVNDILRGATELGISMWGVESAVTQGDKIILPESKRAIDAVRTSLDLKKIDVAMRSDIIKSFEVLRGGIKNQIQEQKNKQPQGYTELEMAWQEVNGFIAELNADQASAESTATKDRAA